MSSGRDSIRGSSMGSSRGIYSRGHENLLSNVSQAYTHMYANLTSNVIPYGCREERPALPEVISQRRIVVVRTGHLHAHGSDLY